MELLVNIEFFSSPIGEVYIKPSNEPMKMFESSDRELIEQMLVVLNDRYPGAFKRLSEIYSRYEANRYNYEYKMIHRFVRCNFGEFDQQNYDINHSGHWNFEEVRCPLRGECKHECIICKPIVNTSLTEREMEILKLIAECLQAQEISEVLNISVSTVNRHRENIKFKLKLDSVSKLVKYYHENCK